MHNNMKMSHDDKSKPFYSILYSQSTAQSDRGDDKLSDCGRGCFVYLDRDCRARVLLRSAEFIVKHVCSPPFHSSPILRQTQSLTNITNPFQLSNDWGTVIF